MAISKMDEKALLKNRIGYPCRVDVSGMDIIYKKCPFKLFIDRPEKEFGYLFKIYFKGDDFKSIKVILNARTYTASETGISSRVLNHWASKDILPTGLKSDSGEWKKFSFVEIVWLRSVLKMREFGLSIEQISKVRSWVLQWDSKYSNYPWFEFYIILALFDNQDIYIAILPDGTAELATSFDLERLKQDRGGMSEHFLLISLKNILAEIGTFNVAKIKTLRLLDDKEEELLSALNKSDVKEVKARVRNGHIKEIQTVQTYPNNINVGEINKEIESLSEYAEVLTRHSGGVRQSIEVVKKRRL